MKKLTALALSSVPYLAFAPLAHAQTINPCPQNAGGNFSVLCGITFSGGLVSDIITIAFIVATLIALAFLIFGGIKWITSGGDKAGVEAARNTIVAALVGLVKVFLAYFIIRLIFGIFGLNFGTFTLPKITT